MSYKTEPAPAPPAAINIDCDSVANAGVAPNFFNFLKKSIVLSAIPARLPNILTGSPALPLILGSFFT